MEIHAIAETTGDHSGRLELEEFRAQALGPLLWSPLALGVFMLLQLYDIDRPNVSWVPILLAAATGLAALAAARCGVALSGGVLLAGLTATVAAAQLVYPGAPLVVLYALVVFAASAVLGPLASLPTAAVATGIVLWLRGPAAAASPAVVADAALFGVWVAAGLAYLATSPARVALEWAWSAYAELRRLTEQMRDRQGELGRVSRSLADTCARLEVANRELEQARRAAEEAERRKNEFAATISHELRTPLNLIIGFSEMMAVSAAASYDDQLPESYRGDVQAVYRNACHLSSLIDDVLDLSQVDAHRLALEKKVVSLPRIVDEAVTSVATLYKERRLALDVQLAPDLPLLYADATRVRQVLINLLTNALRYTDAGGVAIAAAYAGGETTVSVRDTGVGIAPRDLERVFEGFQQVGTEGRRGRAGLGLTVSKRLVELHGGSMWVESLAGQGSAFHFTLPVCQNVVASPLVRVATPAPDAAAQTRPGIVVLDEEGGTSRVLQRYLDGYELTTVARPEEARELVGDAGARAVIAASPRLAAAWRGLQLARPAGRDLPLLHCSVRSRDDVARELGVAAYLTKPIAREELRAALRQLGRRLERLLIVDDDADMVRMLARMVRSTYRACQVREAHDGAECLRLLREAPPDALVLDLVMPGVDGYAVLEEMRGDEGLRGVPVVVISARRAGEDALVAGPLEVSRSGGLAVSELTGCLKSCLDVLLARPDRPPQDGALEESAGPTSPAMGWPGGTAESAL